MSAGISHGNASGGQGQNFHLAAQEQQHARLPNRDGGMHSTQDGEALHASHAQLCQEQRTGMQDTQVHGTRTAQMGYSGQHDTCTVVAQRRGHQACTNTEASGVMEGVPAAATRMLQCCF